MLWKTCIGNQELDSFPKLKDFSDKMKVILINVIFFIVS